MIGRFVAQAGVVARRDFFATVGTPAFLMFLFAPLFMMIFAVIGGTGATMIAESGDSAERIVVIAEQDFAARIEAADSRLRDAFPGALQPPELEMRAPEADPRAQARALFDADTIDVSAVLYGEPGALRILHAPPAEPRADYLGILADAAARDAAAGLPADRRLAPPEHEIVERMSATIGGQQSMGFAALFVIFLLTLLLAGQTVSMLAEEKGNKVIEILAAALPLETVFVGKLVGLFGVALAFIAFWGTLAAVGISFAPNAEALMTTLDPAIGLGAFLGLGVVYFAMGYFLLGAVFLGVGAQASSMREIQMLSLPITFFQMGMFGFASAAAGSPGSTLALAAELFPFSSPFAMAAKGATDPRLWVHGAAIAWQLLWVTITIALAARWFRRGVLKSGPSVFRRVGRYLRRA